jgi:hypothetical protein
LKDHGGRGLVLWGERWWYTHHQPPVGGKPNTSLLGAPNTSASPPTAIYSPPPSKNQYVPPHLDPPKDIRPIASNPLPREGVWKQVGPTVDNVPTEYVAYLRPDNVHNTLTTGVAWMDTKLLSGVLVAGTQSPGGGGWPWHADVPKSKRSSLAATFNSGFLLADSGGGFYSNGQTAGQLRNGSASLVFYKDGTVTVGEWGRDVSMTNDVTQVRQNLKLIVDNGSPVPGLANDSLSTWGATLGNAVLVWRSAVGVTQDGALVYAGGDGLSIGSLARVMARAGAVRAMELDINDSWVSFNYYNPRSSNGGYGVHAAKLLPTMVSSQFRYLSPDERDFIAMFIRPQPSPAASAGGAGAKSASPTSAPP